MNVSSQLRFTAILILLAVILGACADPPEPTPTPTPVIPTATPFPTSTPTPVPPTATPEPTLTPTPRPTDTPIPTPTFAPEPIILPTVEVILETPTPTSAFPTDLEQRLDAIAYKTSVSRNLPTTELVERELIDKEEFRRLFLEDLGEDAEELALDTRLYRRLGIIEPDTDLGQILTDVFSDIVLGFYDTDENKMYILADKDEFTLNDHLTVAHEVTHALQQYEFDIGGLADSLDSNADRRLALRALIEGDALLSELLYMLSYFDEDQQAEAQSNQGSEDLTAFYAAPVFIQNTITFPYSGGYQFAVSLYLKRNDFSHIDLAYETLPASTEQIIHPAKYDAGEEPIEISVPDPTALLGEGWTVVERNVMGELFLRSYFESDLDRETAAAAAAGWGGDEFLLLETPTGEDALSIFSVWDTEEDANEFADTFRAYGEAVSGREWTEVAYSENLDEPGYTLETSVMGSIRIRVTGDEVRVIVAPDADAVNALFEALESLKSTSKYAPSDNEATSTSSNAN